MRLNSIYLNFAGNAEEVFNFYKSVLKREFDSLVRFKDMPMPGTTLSEVEGNKIMNIALPIGSHSALMASDALESLGQKVVQGNNFYINLSPESKQEADRLFAELSAGGSVEMAMADMPWGDYWGCFRDKFGIGWMISIPSN
ncbi:MAG: VOC family protein [Spirochaetota bacterium]